MVWQGRNMPTVSHSETNVLSCNQNPNVHIPGAFNNNVVTESGAIKSMSRRVRSEQGAIVDDV
jgi:hypothetical protein